MISGRVNYVCGPQSISFKTIIEKSYFGEIEIFHNTPRLFSARAHVECNLLTIKKKVKSLFNYFEILQVMNIK